MKRFINRLMARLGYVPAAAQAAPSSIPLKIEVDSSQVRAALEPVQQLAVAATEAEAALARLWNIQAAMRNGPPYAGVGKVSGSNIPASDAEHPCPP